MIPWGDDEARQRQWQVARLPSVLHGLARALRTGVTLPTAIERVAADSSVAGPALQRMAHRIAGGAAVVDEVDGWAASLRHRDADLVRAILGAGMTTGSALAASFDRAAASLQDRAELAREIRALSAQARASALVLTVAPVVFLGVMAMIDPAVARAVVGTTAGRLAVASGVVLDGIGWYWMARLVAGIDR